MAKSTFTFHSSTYFCVQCQMSNVKFWLCVTLSKLCQYLITFCTFYLGNLFRQFYVLLDCLVKVQNDFRFAIHTVTYSANIELIVTSMKQMLWRKRWFVRITLGIGNTGRGIRTHDLSIVQMVQLSTCNMWPWPIVKFLMTPTFH